MVGSRAWCGSVGREIYRYIRCIVRIETDPRKQVNHRTLHGYQQGFARISHCEPPVDRYKVPGVFEA